MRISRLISRAALAGMLAIAAVPAPGNAQFGKLLKKVVKEKVTQTVLDKAAEVAGVQADTASAAAASPMEAGVIASAKKAGTPAPQPGPRFSEYLLEITPELLDRLEKGLAAEVVMRQEIAALIGKELASEDYERCYRDVVASPEGQKVYLEAGDLMNGDTSMANIQKMSLEMGRRFEKLIEPRCGLASQKRQRIRDQYAERLAAAAPQAAGLQPLQLSLLTERILPFCSAVSALAEAAGEFRIGTELSSINWVYTRGEVDALRPRCEKLVKLFNAGN